MNKYSSLSFSLIISVTLICCGGKKTEPSPHETVIAKESIIEEIMAQESSGDLIVALLYEFEESIVDIQRQTAQLHTRITEKEAILEEIMAQESYRLLGVEEFN